MKLLVLLPVGMLLVMAAVPAVGEPPNFTVRVLDEECRPLPGVSVVLVPPGAHPDDKRGIAAVTDARGNAIFKTIPAGRYEAVSVLRGFVDARIGPFGLSPNSYLRASAIMSVSWESPDNHMVNPQR